MATGTMAGPPSADVEAQREQQARADLDLALRRLGEHGAVGILAVDARFLAAVERHHGHAAARRAATTLTHLTRKALESHLTPSDMVLEGDSRLDELLVLFFRPRTSLRFFVDVLPTLPGALSKSLVAQRSRLGQSGQVDIPEVPVGHAVVLHGASSQLRRELESGIERARDDAALFSRLARRQRRHDLTRMILGRDLEIVYQPIVSLRDRTVLGHEALLRVPADGVWRNPADVFRTAEREELISELDVACRMAALRGVRHRLPEGERLFLNTLPSAIFDSRFQGDQLGHLLATFGLRPEQLVVELSERTCLHNLRAVREARERLRALGIAVALDDVGSSPASISTLMELEPEYAKIDIALVRAADSDVARQRLVRAVQDTVATLGAASIAEGIETEEELRALVALGVPFGQGFHLGRPGPLSARPR
ncbi:MAG: hypothetical protein Kow0062_05790 [Acidobacteriota bacterium]